MSVRLSIKERQRRISEGLKLSWARRKAMAGRIVLKGTKGRGKRRNKFNARGCRVGGKFFHSKKEAMRWIELLDMEQRGVICDLQRQVPFILEVNGELICKYVCDFRYIEKIGTARKPIVEDVKSPVTKKLPEYRLKKKLMAALHGIHIMET